MPRHLQPELLDTLPPQHPDAIHSRRDLRMLNRVMGNHAWFLRMLPPRVQRGERVLEIGAGTGELARSLNQRGVTTDALDQIPKPEAWPANSRWHVSDLRQFDRYSDYAIVIGNLIFHHLDDHELKQLGEILRAQARIIAACEPARSRTSQWMLRCFGPLFGANRVTLHDGHVSIAGGFSGSELSDALGLFAPAWKIEYSRSAFGGYQMIATRHS